MELNEYRRHNGFTTPEGYFEQLNRKIEDATCNNNGKGKKRIITQPKFAAIMSYAAMIAVVAVVARHIIAGHPANNNAVCIAETAVIDGLDDSDFIDNMLASYPIDEYTFYCCLTEED